MIMRDGASKLLCLRWDEKAGAMRDERFGEERCEARPEARGRSTADRRESHQPDMKKLSNNSKIQI